MQFTMKHSVRLPFRHMPNTGQLELPFQLDFGRVQFTPFQPFSYLSFHLRSGDKPAKIKAGTPQGVAISQLTLINPFPNKCPHIILILQLIIFVSSNTILLLHIVYNPISL